MKQKHAVGVLLCTLALVGSVAINASAVTLSGQTCKAKGSSSSGGCSGNPNGEGACTGGKTDYEYSGCTQCASGSETDSCDALDVSQNCSKRSRTTPCVVGSGGGCVEGQAGAWNGWATTAEKDC